ncbi:branched-chain amino acid ABC transporter substrate-binding protein [Rathayibacter soli]|uniref:branched-chain amino acid ABC transporter substrate-binding protein n=1 Tax=Rathayibacter soli TaxID=3144168 RepID=UPI0027E421BC|nr:branched-chain amino acid ABC transporter substrate-binding protein [Glaciibacter superstes]
MTSVEVPKDAVLPAGDGNAKCPSGLTIAYIGAETGPNAQLGINIYNGVQLAVNQANKANPGCQVNFKKFDTEGDPTKATGPVTQAVNEPDIIGVIGLPFSGESKATGNIFDQGDLVHITPSATNPTLTDNGWKTFFRGLGNDSVQGPAAATLLTSMLKLNKVYVVQDDSDYGIGLGGTTTAALGSKLVGTDKVTTGQKDFSAVVSKIINAKPDAVYYSGYYAEAAPFDQQLVAKGYTGVFAGPDGVKDDQFIKQGGAATNNAYFTCPCIPGELIKSFSDAYAGVSGGAAPGTYSIEGYDAATILLTGIGKGNADRAKLLDFVKNYDADGLSKHYKWNSKGELATPTVFAYKVDNGSIVPLGPIK